jgi:hypothetical protein
LGADRITSHREPDRSELLREFAMLLAYGLEVYRKLSLQAFVLLSLAAAALKV